MEDIDIIEIFWDALDPGETEEDSWVSRERWELLYQHGIVDPKRIPLPKWMDILNGLNQEEGLHAFKRTDLPKVNRFLYQGAIKKPFDPYRLKDGLRPLKWVQEMYQKVLKFETLLKVGEWNNLIQQEVNPKFKVDDHYRSNKDFKDWVATLLQEKASPLRRLEVWVHEGSPLDELPGQTPTPKKAVTQPEKIEDRFVASPEEGKKIKSIEKVFYQGDKAPPVSDDEALDFLKELEAMEDDPDSPLK